MKKALTLIALAVFVVTAYADEPVIYPAKGQSQKQMEKDKYSCYGWAKKQTGFDPMQPPPAAQAPSQPQGERLRGAARGAAGGAAIGAIAGNAGKGAAAGAVGGTMVGGMRQRQKKSQSAQAQQQQTADYEAKRNGYNRAFGACMEGRGYTVK
ncbi:MAG: YMGG-like glycine zipper-containing protein [Geobacteraceae bacterium]|nr:YMGG-like glycine zipper-containing protein [Geobacteraceae bacterium]